MEDDFNEDYGDYVPEETNTDDTTTQVDNDLEVEETAVTETNDDYTSEITEEEEVTDESESEDAKPDEVTVETEEVVNEPWKAKSKGNNVQKRISQLTKARKDEEARNAQLEARIKELEEATGIKTDTNKELTRADFADDSEFINYKVQTQVNSEMLAQAQSVQAQQAQQAMENKVSTYYQENVTNTLKDIPDYNEVITQLDNNLFIDPKLSEQLMGAPAGPYTLYRIASDPELNAKLVKTSGNSQEDIEYTIAQIYNKCKATLDARKQNVTSKPKLSQPPKNGKPTHVTNMWDLDDEAFMEEYNK